MAGPATDAVLLFYKEYEADRFLPYDRYLKRILRPLYNRLHRRQKQTGFYVSFHLMVDALRSCGIEVRVNDYRTAAQRPDQPVGLLGFPGLLSDWRLPNPALLGPSLYDHPGLAPELMKDPRFQKYVVLAPWTQAMFQAVYGDVCVPWFAGIDTEAWPDMSARPKDIDVLVYDKIRWDREQLVPALLEPICDHLKMRGLRRHVVRYKHHDHALYRELLARSRCMIFICEHETQGIAYQEAMACNLPILAWDNGYWLDPLWRRFSRLPIPASSVPFFSPDCGERFAGIDEFEASLERFWAHLSDYRPRRYVQRALSPERSARTYLDAYWSVAGRGSASAA